MSTALTKQAAGTLAVYSQVMPGMQEAAARLAADRILGYDRDKGSKGLQNGDGR